GSEATPVQLSGATSDLISSVFPDYNTDSAYVGTADGKLHKITGVFGGTPTEVTTGNWPLTIATNLTSPVLDVVTGRICIGDGAGVIHMVRTTVTPVAHTCSTGSTPSTTPPCVDSTTVTPANNPGAFDDGPIVTVQANSTDNRVFTFNAGSGNGNFT